MKKLIKKIQSLQAISIKLEPDETSRNALLNDIHEFANSFINTLDDQPTYSNKQDTPGSFNINGSQMALDAILKLYKKEVVDKGIKPASGGHIGYIPGGGIYTTALADYLSDITNIYTGIHFASPGGVAIEHAVLDWLKEIFGFPQNAVGNLTSGGSIANLIALTAARDKHQVKSARIPQSVVYLSKQVHHCIQKSLRIIGLEDVIIRYVGLDDHSRIKPSDLEVLIRKDKASGLHPFLIVASAGTTDTGAIDPLKEISIIAKENQLWFHIDGAYGGFFILTPEKKELFDGIELADSLVIDPHKGLFLPYGLGAVLVKDKESVFHSNHYFANYMQDAVEDSMPVNPADVSPELTKPFRALRLWLPLVIHGIEPFIACLQEKLLLTTYFREGLKALGFELGPEPALSVSYFWYPTTGDQNAFNRKLMEEIHKDGEVFLSSTLIDGKFVIRMAILSFRTKLHTIDKTLSMIDRAKNRIKIT